MAERSQPSPNNPAPRWFLNRFVIGGGIIVLSLAVAAFVFLWDGASNGVSGPDDLDFAKVVVADLVQQESFNGTLGSIQDDPVRTKFGGTVTAIASPGGMIGQGGTLFEIDGEPVVLLFGDAPAFRDMAIGEDAFTISSQLTGTITEVAETGSVIRQGDAVYAVDGEPVIALFGAHPAFRDLTMGDNVVTVSSQAGGVITEVAAPGTIIEQGDVLFRVNDRPVIALYGEYPAFRSLSGNEDAVAPAAAAVAFAERDLTAANTSLGVAQAAGEAMDAQSAVTAAELAYRERLVRWLGAVPEGFALLTLDQILGAWETTLTAIYASPVTATDDLATPWNEAVVWAWTTLWPVPVDVEATSSPDPDTPLVLAPRGEITDAWTTLFGAWVAYDALVASDAAAVLAAEKAVATAEGALAAAKTAQAAMVTNAGADVQQLEIALAALGYDAGGALLVDGAFTAETTDAVLAFQAANGLLQDGVVDLGEIVFLPGVAQVTDLLASPGDSSGGTVLQLSTGDPATGADVLQLEQALIALGYDAGGRLVADGVSNADTTLAVLALQAAAGLEQDGVFDLGEVVFIPGPSQVLDVLKVPGQPAGGGIVMVSTGELATGADVRQLEEALVGLGHDAGGTLVADGVYSVETIEAVRTFQEASGLAQDGIINLGEVVFLPGELRVTNQFVTEGGGVGQGASVLGVSLSAKVVRVDLPASDQGVFGVGDAVVVEMPDFTEAPATVLSVAETATGAESGPATFDVVIALDDPAIAADFDEAPVDVIVVSDAVVGATAVPVSALVALLEGGYAVEIDDGEGGTRLVGVEVGFLGEGGLIEITEGALVPGDRVVVP